MRRIFVGLNSNTRVRLATAIDVPCPCLIEKQSKEYHEETLPLNTGLAVAIETLSPTDGNAMHTRSMYTHLASEGRTRTGCNTLDCIVVKAYNQHRNQFVNPVLGAGDLEECSCVECRQSEIVCIQILVSP